jgi:hypothetical protein
MAPSLPFHHGTELVATSGITYGLELYDAGLVIQSTLFGETILSSWPISEPPLTRDFDSSRLLSCDHWPLSVLYGPPMEWQSIRLDYYVIRGAAFGLQYRGIRH